MFSPKEDSFAALTLGAQQAAFVDENGNISSDITYVGYSKDSALLVASMLDVCYMAFFLSACFSAPPPLSLTALSPPSRLALSRLPLPAQRLPASGAFPRMTLPPPLTTPSAPHLPQ